MPEHDPVQRIRAYHERSKHHPGRYAPGPGYLDWESQPDPFRSYADTARIDLPLVADELATTFDQLHGPVEARPLELDSLAAFLELALGLTAWKEFGDARWSLRSDPSSGNLHPTEGYLVLPAASGLATGVYHYLSRDHCLEERCRFDVDVAVQLPPASFLVGISSIHWREAWKYGERAFRYCQHDAGHVIATLRYAAAALGWHVRLLDDCGDELVARLLGLDRSADFASVDPLEREHPDALLVIGPRTDVAAGAIAELAEIARTGSWSGTPNELSGSHLEWAMVERAAAAAHKPSTPAPTTVPAPADLPQLTPRCATPAATIIRGRRSAVALDGATAITSAQFYAMLDATLPRAGVAPFDALPWEARVHLGIFVHRVEGLAPGLYLLARNERAHLRFETLLAGKALDTKPADCPEHLRFFCIKQRDQRQTAGGISCGQEIASDGAFSLGMLAEYRDTIARGAFHYRRLFWEAGVLGQALYLQAEAFGVRGTGIGCYFDDAFHRTMGLEDDEFQSLYHFTVGTPVEDTRLVTHPPYEHLGRARRTQPS